MDALWRTGAATVALVAEDAGAIVGQVSVFEGEGRRRRRRLARLRAAVGSAGAPQARRRRRPHARRTGAVARARRQRLRAGGRSEILPTLRLSPTPTRCAFPACRRRSSWRFCSPAKRQAATWNSTRRLRRLRSVKDKSADRRAPRLAAIADRGPSRHAEPTGKTTLRARRAQRARRQDLGARRPAAAHFVPNMRSPASPRPGTM